MTERQAYKRSLALPFIMPIFALAVIFIGEKFFSGGFGGLLFLIFGSGLVGGIPYFIVCLGILWWTRKRSIRALKIAILCSPWMMIPVVFIFLVILVLRQTENVNARWLGFEDTLWTYGSSA